MDSFQTLIVVFSSRQLRCLYFRTANPGNAFRSFECSHRVGAGRPDHLHVS